MGRHAADVVRRGWGAPGLHRGRWAVVTGAMSALLVAVLVVAAAVLGPVGERAHVEPTLVPAPAAAPTPARSTDPRTDAQAPRSRPAELLGVLADARAAAWREATPALLGEADAPRSAAAVRDAAAVSEVARAGVRYTGLRYTVAEVVTVSATPDRAVLRARIHSGAYAVTGAAGSTARPAVAGVPVLVDLVRTDVGWRVSDLRPAR